MKTYILIVVAAIALSVSGVTTWAQHFDRGPREARDRNPNRDAGMRMRQALLGRIVEDHKLAKEIGLSEEQVTALRDGFYELKKQKISKRAELELAATEQARILTQDEIDESALMAAIEETGRIRTEFAKLQMKTVLLLRQTLDEEQRQRLAKMVRRRMNNRIDRRSGGSGPKRGDRRQHGPGHDGDREGRHFEDHDRPGGDRAHPDFEDRDPPDAEREE